MLGCGGPFCTAGMTAWGDHVLKFTGKQRADMYRDLVVFEVCLMSSVETRTSTQFDGVFCACVLRVIWFGAVCCRS